MSTCIHNGFVTYHHDPWSPRMMWIKKQLNTRSVDVYHQGSICLSAVIIADVDIDPRRSAVTYQLSSQRIDMISLHNPGHNLDRSAKTPHAAFAAMIIDMAMEWNIFSVFIHI